MRVTINDIEFGLSVDPETGALREKDATDAIVNPAKSEGVRIEASAVRQILSVTTCIGQDRRSPS